MISSLFGNLPVIVYPAHGLVVNGRGRTLVWTVRGKVQDERVDIDFHLDADTGELLLSSNGRWVGSFRVGDLVSAQVLARKNAAADQPREVRHVQ